MLSFIKNKIKVKLKQFIIYSFPEWNKLLSQENNLLYLKNQKVNTTTGKNVKLYGPFRIYESSINDYTYVSYNSTISKTSIGKFCSIGPNFLCGWGIHPTSALSTAPMFYSTEKQNGMTLALTNKIEERRSINIGNDVFIGANVTVLDGITIGDGAIIGAGAVVAKDIPPYAIAVGCPVQIIKYRFDDEQILSLLKIKWWDFSEDKLNDVEKMFFDVNLFVNKYKS